MGAEYGAFQNPYVKPAAAGGQAGGVPAPMPPQGANPVAPGVGSRPDRPIYGKPVLGVAPDPVASPLPWGGSATPVPVAPPSPIGATPPTRLPGGEEPDRGPLPPAPGNPGPWSNPNRPVYRKPILGGAPTTPPLGGAPTTRPPGSEEPDRGPLPPTRGPVSPYVRPTPGKRSAFVP